jgi:ATP adenylyltransferase
MPPPSAPFDLLREFISSRMRMSHVFQPLMLKTLIQNGGWASTRDIAASFLAQDDSQIDYYAEITKRMPG